MKREREGEVEEGGKKVRDGAGRTTKKRGGGAPLTGARKGFFLSFNECGCGLR